MKPGAKRPVGRPRNGDGSTAALNIRLPLAKGEAYRQAAAARGVTLTDLVIAAVDAMIAG